MKRVAVAIVNHSNELSANELIDTQQIYKLLGKYDIFWVVPETLQADYLYKQNVVRFSDEFFVDRQSNSKLMLSSSLYERFIDYEYVLFCQTDVFIFKDELLSICDWGYDYIGAPTFEGMNLFFNGKSVVHVFNGGLSLRRTIPFIEWIKSDIKRIDYSLNYQLEDTIISELGFGYLRLPDEETALRFSVNSGVEYCLAKLNGDLPFGCHGWERQAFDTWKPIIEKCGYSVLNMVEQKNKMWAKNYNAHMIKKAIHKCLSEYSDRVCVWGMGFNGLTLADVLNKTDDMVIFMDQDEDKVTRGMLYNQTCRIEEGFERKWPIIIACSDSSAMCDELDIRGYTFGRSYTTYGVFMSELKQLCLESVD